MTIAIAENNKCTLQQIFPVAIAETDCVHNVKPVAIASQSIERYDKKYGCEAFAKLGYAWFLIRYHIEFENQPKNTTKLRIQTESRGIRRMNAYRDFEVYDDNTGVRILRATSLWFVIDLKNKSVVNAQKEFLDFNIFEPREDDLELRKLTTADKFDNEKVFHVRYDDIDVNNHVNNTVYITWALEALDYNFRKNNRLKTLDIYFKHEAKYGEDIISQVKIDKENKVTEHLIKSKTSGEELCLLRAEFEKIQ